MNKPHLTFEWSEKHERLEIHASEAGLHKLADMLRSLVDSKSDGHTHLMSPSWGGDALSESKQGSDNRLINHVVIYRWPEGEPRSQSQRPQ